MSLSTYDVTHAWRHTPTMTFLSEGRRTVGCCMMTRRIHVVTYTFVKRLGSPIYQPTAGVAGHKAKRGRSYSGSAGPCVETENRNSTDVYAGDARRAHAGWGGNLPQFSCKMFHQWFAHHHWSRSVAQLVELWTPGGGSPGSRRRSVWYLLNSWRGLTAVDGSGRSQWKWSRLYPAMSACLPAPHWGIFITRPIVGGAISSPLLSETTGPILKNSSGIWKPWKNCRRKTNFIDLGVTSDVTCQVKVKMFDISGLVTSASKIAMLSTNKAN